MILLCKINRKVSFLQTATYQPHTSVLATNNETLRLFSRKKTFMCTKEKKRKEKSNNYKRKKQQWLLLHCCFFYILLNNLEADTQRMRMLIPISAKQYELANLGGRTDMLADTWTNIIITDTNQTQGLARIIRQTV